MTTKSLLRYIIHKNKAKIITNKYIALKQKVYFS